MTSVKPPRVFVALDFENPMRALALADRLDPRACGLKVGKEMFVVAGPEPVRWMVERGFAVFLDLKFHDIPNTVAQACAAATRLGVAMLNVHAGGGRAMLSAARDAVMRTAQASDRAPPLLIAVTVLTSLGDADLREMGQPEGAADLALRLARLTRDCGLDGVVCSALEAPALRAAFGPSFALVTQSACRRRARRPDASSRRRPRSRTARCYLVVGRPSRRRPIRRTLAAINRSIESTE
jgi:orotidine-5'-phosphate decarboxylase